MVNITIDGKKISAEENITIMEAAEKNGIPIPKLCYLKGINEIAACRVCVVELEGKEKLITSCNNLVKEGMVIHTNSPKVRNQEEIRSSCCCPSMITAAWSVPRNGNCGLQQVAYDLNILEIPFKQEPEYAAVGIRISRWSVIPRSASSACAVFRSVIRSRDSGSGMWKEPVPERP